MGESPGKGVPKGTPFLLPERRAGTWPRKHPLITITVTRAINFLFTVSPGNLSPGNGSKPVYGCQTAVWPATGPHGAVCQERLVR